MKNKTLLLIAMSVTLAMNVIAQSNTQTTLTEQRSSLPYHYINIKGEMNVKLVQDEMPGVSVEGTNYQLGNTVTMLRSDTLFVYQTNRRKSDGKTWVTINVNDLALLEVSGKTKVDCSGLVNTDYLTVRAKDGAQIKLDVRALKVQSEVTGCSFICLTGNAASNVESVDGCGSIDSHLLDVMERRVYPVHLCSKC